MAPSTLPNSSSRLFPRLAQRGRPVAKEQAQQEAALTMLPGTRGAPSPEMGGGGRKQPLPLTLS